MIDILDPKFGEKIYDPTCGTGGFLISTFNYIKKRSAKTNSVLKKLKEETIYGRELTSTARIAKMNMIITGDGHTNIEQLDSLDNPINEEYDVVVANPPYGQSTDHGHFYSIPDSSSDGIFLQHIITSLKIGGRAAVVIPEGLLFRDVDLDLRKYLLQYYNIIAIISLPKGVFRPYAKQNKTNIIILEKYTNPKKPEGTKSIWFYDLQEDGFDLNSDLRPEIEKNDIPDLLDKWSEKLDGEKSWSVDIEKIKEKNFDLMVKTYRPEIEYVSKFELVPFSEIMKENKNTIIIDDKQEYQRITVKLHGYGVVPRDLVIGKKIKTKEQKVTRENQFIVAEIDAKLGAFGIISKQWTNSIVSSHYFLFDLDDTKILPEYFDYVIRQGPYTEMIQPFVKGTTNYASIRPKHILKLKMPLPKIPEQQKILDIISKKKQHLVELEKAKEKAVKDIQIIVDELFQKK
jgi:type I restriction enzyme M protein